MSSKELTRINKYLSKIGYCSRRAADKLIEQGRVTINGEVPEMGTKISNDDQVKVNGELVSHPKKKKMVYLAFNKPVGIVCTTDTKREKNNIIDYINYPTRIFPIGRLDKPSEGLIFLTNLAVTLLPEKISEIIYILIVGNKNINKRRKLISGKIFNPINTEMKNIRLGKKITPSTGS